MSHGDHSDHNNYPNFQDHANHPKLSTETSARLAASMIHQSMATGFHFGTEETLLFEFWKVNGPFDLLWSCVVIFAMAFVYEGVKTLRIYLAHRERRSRYTAVRTLNGVATSTTGTPEEDIAVRSGLLNLSHLQQTCIYMAQLTLAYLLMLLFMCYNVWVCLAIVLGAGSGYFVFGWYRSSTAFSVGDHCTT
ncbi:high affinity copper uptake protein 1-like [Tropilaelaps mercedesae]|uniref:Copper transport protein n=1 Tax=Tropilaelaps mercedesae TaxID=418985 RepID=A0A1V9XKI8_9ACAR|nr:high affinity copper uptake protein 1-like [Tropilaelaps mercedesae]